MLPGATASLNQCLFNYQKGWNLLFSLDNHQIQRGTLVNSCFTSTVVTRGHGPAHNSNARNVYDVFLTW